MAGHTDLQRYRRSGYPATALAQLPWRQLTGKSGSPVRCVKPLLDKSMRLLASLLLLLWLGALPVAHAQGGAEEEHLLKAVFVYNFAKFTRWPESSWSDERQPLGLCTVGEDKLLAELERLSGRAIQGRTVDVVPLQRTGGWENCQVLYIARSEKGRYHTFVESLRGKPVLTVSEIHGFARSGGTIELYRDGEKIRFLINLTAARDAGLEISSRLLSLAEVIEREETP